MKDFFTCDDFDLNLVTASAEEHCTKLASKQANKKLNALIESWPVVFGSNKRPLDGWNEKTYEATTHKARLAFIEEIVKEPCKHEPVVIGHFNNYKDCSPPHYAYEKICKHCGIELVAEWRTK